MASDPSGISALDRPLSWASLVVLAATATAFAWYVPYSRNANIEIYKDFKVDLPWSMQIACAVPTGVIVASAATAVVLAAAVQFRVRSKRSASLFHLFLTVAFGVTFLVYREAMGNAMVSLIQAVSGSPASG